MTPHALPIFVISLTRAAERRASITAQLERLDLNYRLFDAIDGNALTPEQTDLVDRHWRRRRTGNPLRPAEVGAAMSHALVYREILKAGHGAAVILEDDAQLKPTFPAFVRGEIPIPKDVHLVALHYYQNQFVNRAGAIELAGGYRLYRPYGRLLGACAYYVTRHGAEKLLAAALPVWSQVDWPLNVERELNGRGLEPPVVIHDESFGSQQQEFAQRRIPLGIRLARLSILPTVLAPDRFGNLWMARYAWGAISFKLRAYCVARRVRSHGIG
jgi:glycosyl transferase family 25